MPTKAELEAQLADINSKMELFEKEEVDAQAALEAKVASLEKELVEKPKGDDFLAVVVECIKKAHNVTELSFLIKAAVNKALKAE